MFLKLFPRYAGRARRGATVAGDHLRGTAVVVENAPKSLSRHDGASVIRACRQRCEELVAETLVVPFCVIVHYVFGYRCAVTGAAPAQAPRRGHSGAFVCVACYWRRANPRLSENRRFGSNSLRLPEEPVVTDALRNNAPVGSAA